MGMARSSCECGNRCCRAVLPRDRRAAPASAARRLSPQLWHAMNWNGCFASPFLRSSVPRMPQVKYFGRFRRNPIPTYCDSVDRHQKSTDICGRSVRLSTSPTDTPSDGCGEKKGRRARLTRGRDRRSRARTAGCAPCRSMTTATGRGRKSRRLATDEGHEVVVGRPRVTTPPKYVSGARSQNCRERSRVP
jgi:hypothetical protein